MTSDSQIPAAAHARRCISSVSAGELDTEPPMAATLEAAHALLGLRTAVLPPETTNFAAPPAMNDISCIYVGTPAPSLIPSTYASTPPATHPLESILDSNSRNLSSGTVLPRNDTVPAAARATNSVLSTSAGIFNLTHELQAGGPYRPTNELTEGTGSVSSLAGDSPPPLMSMPSSPSPPFPTFNSLATQQAIPGQFISDAGPPAVVTDPALPGLRLRSGKILSLPQVRTRQTSRFPAPEPGAGVSFLTDSTEAGNPSLPELPAYSPSLLEYLLTSDTNYEYPLSLGDTVTPPSSPLHPQYNDNSFFL